MPGINKVIEEALAASYPVGPARVWEKLKVGSDMAEAKQSTSASGQVQYASIETIGQIMKEKREKWDVDPLDASDAHAQLGRKDLVCEKPLQTLQPGRKLIQIPCLFVER